MLGYFGVKEAEFCKTLFPSNWAAELSSHQLTLRMDGFAVEGVDWTKLNEESSRGTDRERCRTLTFPVWIEMN